MIDINIIITGHSKPNIISLMNSVCDEEINKIKQFVKITEKSDEQELIIQRGFIKVDDRYRLDLYYANKPLQFEYFKNMPTTDLKGLILVLNSKKPSDLNNITKTVLEHYNYLMNYAMCIAVTNIDSEPGFTSDDVNEVFKSNGWVMPVFDVDIGNKLDFELLIESLIYFYKP